MAFTNVEVAEFGAAGVDGAGHRCFFDMHMVTVVITVGVGCAQFCLSQLE